MTECEIRRELERQLAEVPVLAFLGLELFDVRERRVIIRVPFENARNMQGIVFSGAVDSAMWAAGWCLIVSELLRFDINARVVIGHSEITFSAPITGEFYVEASFDDFYLPDNGGLFVGAEPAVSISAAGPADGSLKGALQSCTCTYHILPPKEG